MLVDLREVESLTSAMRMQRSSQLSYRPVLVDYTIKAGFFLYNDTEKDL